MLCYFLSPAGAGPSADRKSFLWRARVRKGDGYEIQLAESGNLEKNICFFV